jgi:MFS transporter, SP family, general alpha glucoside:H+ symporter
MANNSIVPTEKELRKLSLHSGDTIDLINYARESDAQDRTLTIREAMKKYKKACFWAVLLSTSLIMEGYDLVIVSVVRSGGVQYDTGPY